MPSPPMLGTRPVWTRVPLPCSPPPSWTAPMRSAKSLILGMIRNTVTRATVKATTAIGTTEIMLSVTPDSYLPGGAPDESSRPLSTDTHDVHSTHLPHVMLCSACLCSPAPHRLYWAARQPLL